MKKIILFFAALFITCSVIGKVGFNPAKWIEKAPLGYIDNKNDQCRGMALGTFAGKSQKVLAAVTRLTGNRVVYINPADGAVLGETSLSSLNGGAIACNDAEFTEDGRLLICNVGIYNNNPVFKVYCLDSPEGTPYKVIQWNLNASVYERYGDTFTVTGKMSDGSAKVYVVNSQSTGNGRVLRWSMIEDTPGTYIFDESSPDTFYDPGTGVSNPANIDFISENCFVVKGSTQKGRIISTTGGGTLLYEIDLGILPSSGSEAYVSLRHVATDVDENVYFAYLRPNDGTVGPRVRIFSTDPESDSFTNPGPVTASQPSTELLGANALGAGTANGNSAGKIIPEIIEDGGVYKLYLYTLVTNNSISKIEVTGIPLPVPNKMKEQFSDVLNINVANGILSVTGVDSPSITLYNIMGQKVKSAANANQLPVEGLQGVYIATVAQGGAVVKTAKVFIK